MAASGLGAYSTRMPANGITAGPLAITRLNVINWRNFKRADIPIGERMFLVGPNASGKSNLLDALRFLRDLAIDGGGFQHAVQSRGGLPRIRNLAARNVNQGHVTLELVLGTEDAPSRWTYTMSFSAEQRGKRRPILTRETVALDGRLLLDRPDRGDGEDADRLTQTALEQVNVNREFREIATWLSTTRYLHLVPQVIRDPERSSDTDEDPFGRDFLSRVARTPERERHRRLRLINKALKVAVPQLDRLELHKDEDGRPHLQAWYEHWRPGGARQDEKDFSDGTLRLIGLLWALQESGKGKGPVLLEEPELSLHSEIVRQLPSLIAAAARRGGRQILVTTHAQDILEDEGIGDREVVLLQPGAEGTTATVAGDVEGVHELLEGGMNLREALADVLNPVNIEQLVSVSLFCTASKDRRMRRLRGSSSRRWDILRVRRWSLAGRRGSMPG